MGARVAEDFSAFGAPVAEAPVDLSAFGAPAVPQAPVSGPSGNLLTDAGRRVGTAVATSLGGMEGLPRAGASVVDWLGRRANYDIGADQALASVRDPISGAQEFPTASDATNHFAANMGATLYQPQTKAGRLFQGGLNAVPLALANPASIPAAFGMGIGATEAGDSGGPVAGLLGGLLAGRAVSTAGNTGARLAGMASSGSASPTYQAYKRLDLPTDLVGDVTGKPAMQFAQNLAAKMPGAEERILGARNNAIGAWGDALEKTAQKFGTATTMQEAGQALKGSAQQWLGDFTNRNNANWSAFRNIVPSDTQVLVDNFRSTLNDTLNRYGGADNLAKVLQPGLASNLRDALGKDLNGGSSLPWQSVQSIRSALGERLQNSQALDGADSAAIKQLYGALSEDMKSGAHAVSPQAGKLFDLVNAYTRAGHSVLDDHIRPILNADTPEQAATAALQGSRVGGTRLQTLADQLPGGVGNLSAAQLRQMAGADGNSPTAFASSTLGSGAKKPALSPEAFFAMFGNSQPVADLATAGRAMANTEKVANHSNTAAFEGRGLERLYGAIELAKGGREIGGHLGAIGGLGLGMFAPSLLGRAAASVALNPHLSRLYSTPPKMAFDNPPAIQAFPVLPLAPSAQPQN